MRKVLYFAGSFLVLVLIASQAFAHTPLMSCYDDGDGVIICEAGFSDGSSAAGAKVYVVEAEDYKGDPEGKELYDGKLVIFKGEMDEFGEFTFKKSETPYIVIFDAGPGHTVEVEEEDITE